ncbi:regulator of G-protein signaling 20-like isoform X3 [Palaemon carinicauda]|uniref:regulator of G-protein signaling 20-like isoform X3 n=1 Tax=Palaemon carinicauda TaxID=392227 RepID=UPI0035B5D1EC
MYSRTPPNHICDHFPKYSRYSPTPSRNYSRSCNCKESSTSMASQDGKSPPKSPEDEVPKEKEKKRDHRSKFPPSKEQMERWTSSISCLLKDPDGVEAFREFLKELEDESGEENEHTKYIDFYIECEEYKIEFKRLEDRAKTIYEEYLAEAAGKPVDFRIKAANKKVGYIRKLLHLRGKEIVDKANFLQIGADKEVGTGGKGVDIGDKLEEDGLEGVSLFDEPLTKVIHKLETGYYVNFCLRLKEKLKL